MSWRYQPVWVDDGDQRIFSLCEVFLDADGKLRSWSEAQEIAPMGASVIEDLIESLKLMLADAGKWEPVEFAELAVGMTFKRTAGAPS